MRSQQKLSAGDSQIRLEIDYDGGGIGKGADLRLVVNDAAVATGRLKTTIASRFSIDEGTDIGMDRGATSDNSMTVDTVRLTLSIK